jgi:hypothetical protein
MPTFGFSQSDWDTAKQEAWDLLIVRARVRGMIPYLDLAGKIKAVHLEAHDQRLFHLLGEISSEEDAAGRGMLNVIVVHKFGDMKARARLFRAREAAWA